MELNDTYWNNRYLRDDFPWDAGAVTTPLKTYIDQYPNKQATILIPGAGNAHEAAYLFSQGFANVYVLDFAEEPLKKFKDANPAFPDRQLIRSDFFEHTGQYDLIIEQTFFCALDPALRAKYAEHMHRLLKPGGKLVGLLFDAPMNADQPPFGGTAAEYRTYFAPYFTFHTFNACYNSIKPREGRELFMILQKS